METMDDIKMGRDAQTELGELFDFLLVIRDRVYNYNERYRNKVFKIKSEPKKRISAN